METAKDYNEALDIAFSRLPDSEFTIHETFTTKVDKQVEVLINHNGPVPTQLTNGWKFKFVTTPSGWEFDSSQRF